MSFIQFIGSLIAVTIVSLIAARLFPNKSKLTSERVISNTARYCPHIDLGSATPTIFISERGDTAVLIFPNRGDGVALATALGDRVVIRQLSVTETNTGLSIGADDFTQPTLNIQLPPGDRQSLMTALQNHSTGQSEPAHA